MDEEYDVVVCGTGLEECILSGLLSVHGKKVLHLDRNAYYGGDSASLNLTHLFEKFKPGTKPPESYGANREWNVDLIPKFIMACGKLVRILLHTRVTKYLEWQVIEGSYVYQHQKAGLFSSEKFIHKVPATEMEALKSPLMTLMEKNRCRSFFHFCVHWDDAKPETQDGFNRDTTLMRKVYEYFNLHSNTIDFIGHAVALYTNDAYLDLPCGPTIDRVKLYSMSFHRYGKSPFIYPVYGLGGLPEGFARLSALNGGTYMLNTPVEKLEFDDSGKVCGVRGENGQVVKCKMVVCDPSYVMDAKKVQKVGDVIRCICILSTPIPGAENKESCQIIIPQKQVNRKHDIYITLVSHAHGVAKAGKYIALVSTTVETDNPEAEILPAMNLLGTVEEKFTNIYPIYHPTDDGTKDQVFVSKSYDATSHFESAAVDVLRIWKNITGKELELTIPPEELQDQE